MWELKLARQIFRGKPAKYVTDIEKKIQFYYPTI